VSLDRAWLKGLLQRREACVLVTVARAEGSVPREAGTKMLVLQSALCGTIGGGHLELRACEIARAMLLAADGDAPAIAHYRFPLGPSLGQCCGGAAELVFERITWPRPAWVGELAALLDAGSAVQMLTPLDDAWRDAKTVAAAPQRKAFCELRMAADPHGGLQLAERILPGDFHVMLFGAGHVGRALVSMLGELPCTVNWIDGREAQFPESLPENVRAEIDDTPETLVRRAFPGTYYLVMTHEHALDQAISEAILRRGDFAWFGLIGSVTKRRLFERRLAARGVSPAALGRMTCPIGISGISGKQPGVIAVAVAAQLLAAYQAQCATQSDLSL
jgi:xanthine dehydrogenase accessory factor